MAKIPVGKTIEEAYGFAFGKYFRVLGIVWLPLVVLAVAGYFVFWPHLVQIGNTLGQIFRAPPNPNFGLEFWYGPFQWLRLLEIFALLVFLVIRVGVTKDVLGLRSGPRFVYLSFGAAELRVIGCYLIAYAIAIAAMIATVIFVAILALVVGIALGVSTTAKFDPHALSAPALLVAVALAIALYCAAVYCFVRLIFLMVPATVAENRIGIGRSWTLMKGNFWRAIFIILAAWFPPLILQWIVFGMVAGPVMAQFITAAQSGSAAVQAQMDSLFKTMIADLPWFWGVGFLFSPIYFGLTSAPSAFAYRALVPAQTHQDAAQ